MKKNKRRKAELTCSVFSKRLHQQYIVAALVMKYFGWIVWPHNIKKNKSIAFTIMKKIKM